MQNPKNGKTENTSKTHLDRVSLSSDKNVVFTAHSPTDLPELGPGVWGVVGVRGATDGGDVELVKV